MSMRLVCSSLLIVAGLGVVGGTHTTAQTLTPPPGATYGQPLPVPPGRPMYYSPFTNYDLLYGYSRGALTAPQPIGHEHIPLGANGYIYRPVYALPPQAPVSAGPPAMPHARHALAAPVSRAPAQPSILRRLPEAPPPAPESVVNPPQAKPGQPAGPREF